MEDQPLTTLPSFFNTQQGILVPRASCSLSQRGLSTRTTRLRGREYPVVC